MKILRWSGWIRLLSLLALGFMLCGSVARSQSDLENALRQYNFETVKGYIQPIADLFGADINSGFYHSALIQKSGFHLAIELVAMGAVVNDDHKTYTAQLPQGFTLAPGSTLKTATVFGGKGTLFRDVRGGVPSGFQYKGSDGIINTPIFPLAVPQLTIGYVYGTEATFRFITTPDINGKKFPKTTLWGVGGRHSVSQYIPNSPVDIAVGLFYNKFNVGDIIDFNSVAFGAQVSKQFSVLVLYGGLQSERSTMHLTYKSSDPTLPPAVDISLDGANTFRGTIGGGLELGVFRIFADASFGSVTNYTSGIGFGL